VSQPGLTAVALPQLEHLLRIVESGDLAAPLTATAIQARGMGAHWSDLAWLASLDRASLEAVLRVAIAERTTRPVPRLELVWTGPEAKISAARDTAVVVRELFARAQTRVLVAGYAFTGGREIFEGLHRAMRDRGVGARIVLHLDDLEGLTPDDSVRTGVAEFIHSNWPFGPPIPDIYYDPRTVVRGASLNLHAKCVVVDGHFTLIGSANVPRNAHARNIEVGVLVEDVGLATDLERQWTALMESGMLLAVRQGTGI
jgi:phosphatidylserine/phosphatidylglycerophosphate/cardiolipin synthase-like enzyme